MEKVRTNDGVLIFAGLIEVEELAGTESKGHALVVVTELIVNFGSHQSSQLALRKGFIFTQSLTVGVISVPRHTSRASIGAVGGCTYISFIEPETSGHKRSIS